jgi:non-ribosomal peptide synthetase component F
VERLLDNFVQLVGAASSPAHARTSVRHLPMMSEANYGHFQRTSQHNLGYKVLDSSRTVHELFEEQVLRTPDAVALLWDDRAQTST